MKITQAFPMLIFLSNVYESKYNNHQKLANYSYTLISY